MHLRSLQRALRIASAVAIGIGSFARLSSRRSFALTMSEKVQPHFEVKSASSSTVAVEFKTFYLGTTSEWHTILVATSDPVMAYVRLLQETNPEVVAWGCLSMQAFHWIRLPGNNEASVRGKATPAQLSRLLAFDPTYGDQDWIAEIYGDADASSPPLFSVRRSE